MKKIVLYSIKYLSILVICACVGLILLTLACSIPRDKIYNNARLSANQLNELGEIRREGLVNRLNLNFYFTDILMINIAYSMDSEKPLESALLMRKNYTESTQTEEIMPKDVLGDKRFEKEDDGSAKELVALVNNNVKNSYMYARYWHGYNVILRPLLVLFNYNVIRFIFCCITVALLIIMLYKLFKDYSKIIAIILLFCLGILDYGMATICINANLCFLIAIIACNIILYKKDLMKNYLIIFYLIGIITIFLDLLTNPIVTLGLPLTIFFIRYNKTYTETKIKDRILMFIKICASWCLGYALFWALKWIICDAILHTGIIKNAFSQILFRSNEQNLPAFDLIKAVDLHITCLGILILITCNIFLMMINDNLTKCVEYIFIGLLPIIWMFVLRNHTIVHHYFAYKNILIFIFANMIILKINIEDILEHRKRVKIELNEKEIEDKESENL